MSDIAQDNNARTWDRPEGSSFEDWMNTRIARFATRKYDFDALKFQADFDPKYRRGQMRYIGTGGMVWPPTATPFRRRTSPSPPW